MVNRAANSCADRGPCAFYSRLGELGVQLPYFCSSVVWKQLSLLNQFLLCSIKRQRILPGKVLAALKVIPVINVKENCVVFV